MFEQNDVIIEREKIAAQAELERFKAQLRAETITNGSRRELSHQYQRTNNLLPQVKGNNKRSGRFVPTRDSY